MPFDVAGARAAGYSPEEILQHLGRTRQIDVNAWDGDIEHKIQAALFASDPSMTRFAGPVGKPVPGQTAPGNIDLHKRPVVRNPDGSISTVRSASFEEDGQEVLVPTVSADGKRILKDKEAWEQYRRTGQHLGKFATPQAATAYAEQLHKEQEQEYVPQGMSTPGDWGAVGRAPAPSARPQRPVGAPFPLAPAPGDVPPENTFQGTMERINRDPYRGVGSLTGPPTTQYTGGPIQVGHMPDPQNLIEGIENVQGSGPRRAQGVSELGRFGMEASAPLLGPVAAARPLSTLAGLGYGMAAAHGTEAGLRGLGVAPGYAQLAGDVAGLGVGVATSLAPWERFAKPGAVPEFIRNEAGEIVIRPSQGWTSTLRDLIEQKVPAKVQPAQLRGILSQASPEEVKWSRFGHVPIGQATEEMAAGEFKNFGLEKSLILSELQQPEITEVLHTSPDTRFGQWTLPGGEKSHELVFQLTKPNPGRFTTPHYPNVTNPLAHTRFNERVTPAGESVLHLEEVQSDWHQAGRKGGYQDPDLVEKLHQEYLNTEGKGNLAYEKWREESAHLENDPSDELLRDIPTVNPRTMPSYKEYIRLAEKSNELYDQWKNAAQGVPDAPFKKDWHELVMKRMIGEAINKGAKKLTWTTGEQQAQRYGLEKNFSRIEYDPVNGKIYADDHSDKTIINERAKPEQLDDYIGREAAERLRAKIDQWEGPDKPMPFIEGSDLKFGGEGMKGFYDKILPDFARSYGKQFGANVSQIEIQTPEGPKTVWSLDITPEMATALKGGQPMFGRKIAKPRK